MACTTASQPTDRPTDRTGRGRRQGSPLSATFLRAVAALIAAASATQATAQPAHPACASTTVGSGEVARVIDGRTFVLSDGSETRLAAIEAPPVSGADPDEEHAAAGQAAKAALEGLLVHHSVVLRSAGAGLDRYGRRMAQVFAGPNAEIWIQSEILTKGYALVAAGGDNRECLSFLRGIERKARAGMLGLWGEPFYVAKEAQYPDDILTELGRFAVVAGKVISVRESGGLVYLNFGRHWTEDFTVTILKRNQRAFVAAGVDPKGLAGRRIEVRGWVEARGGPVIEAARPDQIELVEGK
jgi:endonuclease YncB( thermonuclease family)